MPNVLYLTYDGLLDPLGQSQVLPYVLRLGEAGIRLTVLSYEKPAQGNRAAHGRLKRQLAARGIVWHALTYHKRPAILAKGYDVIRGALLAIGVIVTRRVSVVHARSYVAAVMALVAKRLTGCKFLFDMRGLWVEERVDGHWWRPDSPLVPIAKRFEAALFRRADHVVVLTTGLKALLPAFPVIRRRPELPISVIPTCVDLQRFHGRRQPASTSPLPSHGPFTYVYVGSVGALYLMADVVSCFRVALEVNPLASLLVLTNGAPDGVQALLAEQGVSRDRYRILDVPYEAVPDHLVGAQAAIFLTKPCPSRIAKYATKFGESLASGLPVITNRGSVDIDALLERHQVGIVIDELTQEAYREALERLDVLMRDPDLSGRCRAVATEHLSVDRGVSTYQRIYDALSSNGAMVQR
jgi:glycosyltransferase involved in cell wall biosynthesis